MSREVMQQWLDALELGHEFAQAEADRFHAEMAGYKPVRHAALDKEVESIEAAIDSIRAALAAPQGEPVAWRAHVEQRIRSWRQRTMNRSGDHLAIDDFMGPESIDDLVDFVCDEFAGPHPAAPQGEPVGDNITLPPLPSTDWQLHIPGHDFESAWTSFSEGYPDTDMQNYARAAVLLDRQQRTKSGPQRRCGEPFSPKELLLMNEKWRHSKMMGLLQPAAPQEEPTALQFPTMLRKMWTGSEVQQWLDEQGPLYTTPHPAAPQGEPVALYECGWPRCGCDGVNPPSCRAQHYNELAELAKPAAPNAPAE